MPAPEAHAPDVGVHELAVGVIADAADVQRAHEAQQDLGRHLGDAEIDRLQKIRMSATNQKENNQATIAELRRMSELVGAAPILYQVEAILARNRLRGPVGNFGEQEGITWNIHEWELAD